MKTLKFLIGKAKQLIHVTKNRVQKVDPQILKYAIWSAIGIVAFLLGLLIGCSASAPKHRAYKQNLGITEILDSFVAVMPEGASVIARFSDERHSLYYLKSGHLMRFNAQSKMLEEVKPETTNANLEIYYDDMDDQSGIIAARLSKDEKYIYFTAVTKKKSTNEEEPLKTANYQLNTESLNMLAYDGKALDPIPVKQDSTKNEKPRRQAVSQAETTTAEKAAPMETTIVPAAEPQPVQENTPHEQEPVTTPAE